jgi:hypothetical protein
MSFQMGFAHYITRNNDCLLEGDQPFRFISANIPNLHVNEDPIPEWHRVSEWEVSDAFQTIQALGGRVTRCYTLSIRGGIRPGNGKAHIYAPGEYDEELFRDLDMVLALAHQYGIRLIIPFIDQWDWFGGIKHFAGFRGKEQKEFYTDAQVIDDFKQVITVLMNRVNTYTGIRYTEDKAILAWETGNELDSPDTWTAEIVTHMRAQNPKQLILDGKYGISEASLENPDIDIVSNHYYIDRGLDFLRRTTTDRNRSKGKKAFLIGEFDHEDPEVVRNLLDTVLWNGTCGALIWSLRYRCKNGGFYFQGDPENRNGHCMIWPESPTRAGGMAKQKIEILRQYAFQISDNAIPDIIIPQPPVLLRIHSLNDIRWRGSVGAESYIVERAHSQEGPWITIAKGLTENSIPFHPFQDNHPDPNEPYYRMKAVNAAGISEQSNIENVGMFYSPSPLTY